MKHSIALVTGHSLAGAQQMAANKTEIFTPLVLDLDAPTSVRSALADLVKQCRRPDFLLLNAGMVPGKKRALSAAGVEASETPLIGQHRLTAGLLHSASN